MTAAEVQQITFWKPKEALLPTDLKDDTSGQIIHNFWTVFFEEI